MSRREEWIRAAVASMHGGRFAPAAITEADAIIAACDRRFCPGCGTKQPCKAPHAELYRDPPPVDSEPWP